jgi:hypothetical protein
MIEACREASLFCRKNYSSGSDLSEQEEREKFKILKMYMKAFRERSQDSPPREYRSN